MTTTATPPVGAPQVPEEPGKGMRFVNWASNYVDERTSIGGFVKFVGRKIFPEPLVVHARRSGALSFIVILLSGTFLTLSSRRR